MSYKVQNDWNKNSKWHQTKKTEQKICTWKGARNPIIVPKIYCNAEYWRLAKLMWMVQKYKQLESIFNLMHVPEQVPTGVMQKQADLCISGRNFILIKTEYL